MPADPTRSTKAGRLTPATPGLPHGLPRQQHRSTKAGRLTPATRHQRLAEVQVGLRSTKAGRLTPATQTAFQRAGVAARALNEGREINPGDTAASDVLRYRRQGRSTKAGRLTPATPDSWHGPLLVRLDRSTKAGRLTPATRSRSARRRRSPASLNEGREINPGDTSHIHALITAIWFAQRRPGD